MKLHEFNNIINEIEQTKEFETLKENVIYYMENINNDFNNLEIEYKKVLSKYNKLFEEYEILVNEKDEMHETILNINKHLNNMQPTLTIMQREILKQLKEGLSFNKIAELHNITSASVNYHKKKFISLGLI